MSANTPAQMGSLRFGLSEQVIQKIWSVFALFPQVESVVLYGSRAKGNYRQGSDIDLTLFGENLDQMIVGNIAMQLDDLMLPYTFDLSIFQQIENIELVEHIQRVGIEFYETSK
jgi:predicted nucleotidyltransferase